MRFARLQLETLKPNTEHVAFRKKLRARMSDDTAFYDALRTQFPHLF